MTDIETYRGMLDEVGISYELEVSTKTDAPGEIGVSITVGGLGSDVSRVRGYSGFQAIHVFGPEGALRRVEVWE